MLRNGKEFQSLGDLLPKKHRRNISLNSNSSMMSVIPHVSQTRIHNPMSNARRRGLKTAKISQENSLSTSRTRNGPRIQINTKKLTLKLNNLLETPSEERHFLTSREQKEIHTARDSIDYSKSRFTKTSFNTLCLVKSSIAKIRAKNKLLTRLEDSPELDTNTMELNKIINKSSFLIRKNNIKSPKFQCIDSKSLDLAQSDIKKAMYELSCLTGNASHITV